MNVLFLSVGTDSGLTGSSVESKASLVEEAEAASKYVGEDMEVIDDLEEGSEGGSHDSGDEFSEADEGSATPSSSASSKSESGCVELCLILLHFKPLLFLSSLSYNVGKI